ncbi:MAG: DUF423 domain-containing protein [Desulfobulbaceae bacterium]|nr:DUF423 domain-containing protein [Desulfobulbaceae bacterium]
MIRLFLISGGIFAFAGVLARSLSAHALLTQLNASGKLDNFNLAADYLLVHALALVAIALLGRLAPHPTFFWSGWAFLAGSILFQGTVLIKCFAPMGALGVLTPLGGLFLMLGWLLLAWGGLAARF